MITNKEIGKVNSIQWHRQPDKRSSRWLRRNKSPFLFQNSVTCWMCTWWLFCVDIMLRVSTRVPVFFPPPPPSLGGWFSSSSSSTTATRQPLYGPVLLIIIFTGGWVLRWLLVGPPKNDPPPNPPIILYLFPLLLTLSSTTWSTPSHALFFAFCAIS